MTSARGQHRVELDELDADGWRPARRVMNGSTPRTVISIARARTAMAWPILPRPTMPRVRPRSSRPVNCGALPLAAPHRRVGRRRPAGEPVEQREGVLGGRDRVAGRGVDDGDPGPRGRLEVDVVDADARPPDDDEPRAGGDQLGVDLDLAADDERVVVGQDRAQLIAAARPEPLVDLVVGAQQLEALLRRRARRRGSSCARPGGRRRRQPNDSRRHAAPRRPPRPARRAGPARSTTTSSALDRAEDLLERDRAEVAEPEDLAGELALAAGQDEAARA